MKKCKLIIEGEVYNINASLPSCELEEVVNNMSKSFTGKFKWNPITINELNISPTYREYVILVYDFNEVYKLFNVNIESNKINFSSAIIN
jgi:hypothetical protein